MTRCWDRTRFIQGVCQFQAQVNKSWFLFKPQKPQTNTKPPLPQKPGIRNKVLMGSPAPSQLDRGPRQVTGLRADLRVSTRVLSASSQNFSRDKSVRFTPVFQTSSVSVEKLKTAVHQTTLANVPKNLPR